jgi:hypothetical protein
MGEVALSNVIEGESSSVAIVRNRRQANAHSDTAIKAALKSSPNIILNRHSSLVSVLYPRKYRNTECQKDSLIRLTPHYVSGYFRIIKAVSKKTTAGFCQHSYLFSTVPLTYAE